MKFIKTDSPSDPAKYLSDVINRQLSNNYKVLWLLSGGSAIKVAVEARNLINEVHIGNLTVSLIDERYGRPGHKDSNWQQLLDAGFKMDGLEELPVLQGKDLRQTINDYEIMLSKALGAGQFVIGLFGIGPDGHTAGILPGSPAAEGQRLIAAYHAADYQRLTMTSRAIDRINLAVVYAAGENKRQVLLELSQDLPVSQQPAQALKLASELIIFNDQIGDVL